MQDYRARPQRPAPIRTPPTADVARLECLVFGLNNFGVNLTTLKPGAESALLHESTKN